MGSAMKQCQLHGAYDASLGGCPECAREGKGRPTEPAPLDPDALDTFVEREANMMARSYDDEDNSERTQFSARSGRSRDEDNDEPTDPGWRKRSKDITEIVDKTPPCEAILWVKEGDRRGKIYNLKGDTTIGREQGDLILDDGKVSNPHAKIALRGDKYLIVDILSKNGTFVNNERITSEVVLNQDDVIKIGESTFVLKIL